MQLARSMGHPKPLGGHLKLRREENARHVEALILKCLSPKTNPTPAKRLWPDARDATLITMVEPILNPVWVMMAPAHEYPSGWSLMGGALVVSTS
jgi:hypothetical protein